MSEDQSLFNSRPVRKSSLFAKTALALVLIALGTVAWQWLNTRQRFNEVERALSQKLGESEILNQQTYALAKQAQELSNQANIRTILLERKLSESRDQQEVLQTLYNQLAENREVTALAEVEQLLALANQQLQLAGNVKSALLALQAAEKRLQSLDLPRAIQLRETLNNEIESLRKLPQVDVADISQNLETLAEMSSSLPLISERQPTLNAKAAKESTPEPKYLNPLQKFGDAIWEDIKNLVTVERIDRPEPALLSADHAFYLRENLRLRLLTARIALLQHDEESYRSDIKTVHTWLTRYFDTKHPDTIKAFKILEKISAKHIKIEVPELTESFSAVSRYKLQLEQEKQ